MRGERLTQLVSFEALKLASGIVLLSPFVPLLFMGEEYGEEAPFPYFASHSEPDLVEAVRKGRRDEFAAFYRQGEPPDPQDEATFLSARLNHQLREREPHKSLLALYRELIRLRRTHPVLSHGSKEAMEVVCLEDRAVLCVRRWYGTDQIISVFHFGEEMTTLTIPLRKGQWEKRK